jgi:hypothetical protein
LSAPDRELDELVRVLREDAPQPDPDFVREMDRRMAAKFKEPRRFRLPAPRLGLMPAMAGAAAVLIAVVVAVSLLSSSGDKRPNAVAQSKQASSAPAAAPVPQQSLGGSVRKVERSADMTISTSAGKLQDMADGVGQVAATRGGYVAFSQLSTGDQGTRSGRFVLRIPQPQLESALADIGRLGHVRARSESSQDMTAPYRHVQDRLGNDLLERRTTSELLRNAHGAKAARLRARLRTLSAEIADLSGRMRDLRRRASFTTVNVALEEEQGSGGGGLIGGGPGAAFHDALAVFAGALNLAIRLLPLALLAVLGWLGTAVLRRRRREAALF